MIRNLIFDVYGTLVTSGTGSVDATREIFKEFGMADDAEKIYRRWKELHREHYIRPAFKTERDIYVEDLGCLFMELGIDADPGVKIVPMHKSLYGRHMFPDAEKAMGEIIGKYNCAIGSVTDDEPLRDSIKDTVLERIDLVYTSESLKVYKPHLRFYTDILESTGWKVEETVFIGDSMENDVIGPKKAGLRAVLIDRKGKYDGNSEVKPDAVISSMEELISVLSEM
ncbi:MAG: HAD family hydrolase [Clostridia bacterium]|nr:HAD family hydrolase [Clostridia bacterium]